MRMMSFRIFLKLVGSVALVFPLCGQETLRSLSSPAAPPQPAVAAAARSTAADLAALGLTAQKLTDVSAILNGLTNRTVSIIVSLWPPPAATGPADFSSKSFVVALHSETKKAQDDVLASLPSKEVKVGFRFDNIAGFSAEVTVSGLQALQADPRVSTIEPVLVLEPHLAQGIALIHGMTYRPTYNGTGIAIAICDTGVDYQHVRLGGGGFPNSKVLGGYDFGDNDGDPLPNTQAHGTCCAGIAAGDLGTVGDYIGGVAYNAKLYALKISAGTSGSATTAAMVAAWDWCVTHKNDNTNFPILVISTSFGGGQYFSTCDSTTPSMTTAANNANAAGITVLASSGNDGYCDALSWPACISSVISVGAVYDANFGTYLPCVNSASCAPKTANAGCTTGYYATDATAADKVTAYANVASFLTLLAPANQCYTLDITGAAGYSSGDYYTDFGGTSAACPYAAGAVACLQSAAKAITGNFLTPAEVRSRLVNSGDNLTDTKVAITKPRVHLERAIQGLDTAPVLNVVATTLGGGNTNQSVDPNECNRLTVTLRNDGFTTATNVTATLTTTAPGITISQSYSSYPNLAATATATNLTTFKISSSLASPCGIPVNLTLVLNYNGRASTNSFSLTSGGSNYVFIASSNALVPGTTDIGNHGDDVVTSIALPFPFVFYSQTFTNAALSSNGNLQFASSANTYANTCLPYTSFSYVIAPLWDDLLTSGSGGGIFTSISGNAPDRIFNIEWRTTYYTGGASANFELRLYEGQSRFDFVYGTLNGNGSSATVGCQKDTGSAFTSFGCNAAVLTNGLQLAFQSVCTNGGGACAMVLANFAATPTNGVAPRSVAFTNLSTAATGFAWSFGNGQTSSNLNPTITYTNPGIYTVSLSASDAVTTNTLTRSNYITVLFPPPVAGFTADLTNGLAPLAVSFTNLSTLATNYTWDFGDGDFSSDFEPVHTFTNAGTFTVSLIANGPGGTHSLTITNYITVLFPPPVADFTADFTNGLAPLSVSFTNLSTLATNFTWDFGDGDFSSAFEPVHTFTNAGTFTVSLIANGPGGTHSFAITNYITVLFPPPVAGFTADLTNGIAPLTINFTNLSTHGTNFTWDFGDGNFSTDFEPAHTFTNAGTFTVSLTANGPGGTHSLTITNFITALFPPPVADFTADFTNGIAPLTVSFTNLSTLATNYTWDFSDGNFSSAFEPVHTFTNAGTFTVSLIANGPGGTHSFAITNYITVLFPPLLVINPASLDFGLVPTGALAQASFNVSNAGAALLTTSATADGGPFEILDESNLPVASSIFSLDASTSTNVILHFAPLTEGAFTNAVVFLSNGGNSTNTITGRSLGTLLLAEAVRNGTDFLFTFPTVSAVNYIVESTDSLSDPVWLPLQFLAGDGAPAVITNSLPAAAQQFFRVRAQ